MVTSSVLLLVFIVVGAIWELAKKLKTRRVVLTEGKSVKETSVRIVRTNQVRDAFINIITDPDSNLSVAGMLTHTFGPASHLQDPPCNVKIMTSLANWWPETAEADADVSSVLMLD